eukprot:CAMPEP_0114277812 /NCGR_PEP_ID=MMETSP0059-20121206/999_1 /TAXON_ID=36894 /ORGANISM="Pyramimonas parkeae, Strain CCMP726" /LENGTH=208 /DNA_ID=CAMNT_0001397961 /DNA_START=48 /DNA_END=675 /DNA_ORIENTATION=+
MLAQQMDLEHNSHRKAGIPTWNRTAQRSQGLDQESDISEDDSDNDTTIPTNRPLPGDHVGTADGFAAQQPPEGWSPPHARGAFYDHPAPESWAQQVPPAVPGVDAGMDRGNGRDVNWGCEDEAEDEDEEDTATSGCTNSLPRLRTGLRQYHRFARGKVKLSVLGEGRKGKAKYHLVQDRVDVVWRKESTSTVVHFTSMDAALCKVILT